MSEQSAPVRSPAMRGFDRIQTKTVREELAPAWHHQPEPVRRDRTGRAAPAVGQREGAPSHRGA